MLKTNEQGLLKRDRDYPGLKKYVEKLEMTKLPSCPHCTSEDVAKVNVGVIGRTIALAGTSTKFKLIGNGPKPGEHFCNSCENYY